MRYGGVTGLEWGKTLYSHQISKESGHFGREALEKILGVSGIKSLKNLGIEGEKSRVERS